MLDKKEIIEVTLLGAGEHARVVLDSALMYENFKIVQILDDNSELWSSKIRGISVKGGMEKLNESVEHVIMGISKTEAQKKLAEVLKGYKIELVSVINPTSVISPNVKIGKGVFIGPGSVVNTGTIIKDLAIINSGCIIEHDNILGSFSEINPGVTTGGCVVIGDESFIGMGSILRDHISIGYNTIVGAGSLVLEDIGDNKYCYGSPANVIKNDKLN